MPRLFVDSELNHLDWREGQGRTVEIFDIVVGTERRRGIGRRLFERMLRVIPPNTSMIFAITRIGNTIAHEFYENLGFRIVGRLHNFYRDKDGSESALMYGKDL